MNNGTSATQCLYKALKFKYPQVTKIYVPNNVFVAPINCGLMEYPAEMFEVMKTNHETLNMETNEDYIKSLEHNACVVVVHSLGNIINVPRLMRLRPDLIFLEDNCEGLFGQYEGQFSGTRSLCASISFYGNKTITTGEGGAFLTNDQEIFKYINNIYSHGMSEKRYVHDHLGYNFRMTNIEAGFLYDQLDDYQHILDLKKSIFATYDRLLSQQLDCHRVILMRPEDSEHTIRSYWLYCLLIPLINYDQLEIFMEQKNVQIRPIFYDLHVHAHLKGLHKTAEDPFTTEIANHGLMLPSYPELSVDEQKYIISCIEEYLETH
jgi:perosamine synthetase